MSKFIEADGEIAEYFTSALGVRAQSYEHTGVAFDPRHGDDALVRQVWKGEMVRFDALAATMAQLTPDHRRRLGLVYTPHSWPTWLADALAPRWGGGSFVALAATLPRAASALLKRHPETPTSPPRVLGFFMAQGRGGADALFGKLREDCEAIRTTALDAYEVLRVARVQAEAAAKRARKAALDARGSGIRAELAAQRCAVAEERFNRKLRNAS
jgi:hypothetical protein